MSASWVHFVPIVTTLLALPFSLVLLYSPKTRRLTPAFVINPSSSRA